MRLERIRGKAARVKGREFQFFALGAHGKGLSGGDRIFIELARRWARKFSVTVYVWEEGHKMCRRQKLSARHLSFYVAKVAGVRRWGFWLGYVFSVVRGIELGLKLKLVNNKRVVVYSASGFLMDVLPAFLLKLRFPEVIWLAAWYQAAPKPWQGFSEKGERREKYFLRAWAYWLMQTLTKPLISGKADLVAVNNEGERSQFNRLNKAGRVLVLLGAVPLAEIRQWQRKAGMVGKVYDGVFQGRFHPQKGVVELIDVWKRVVEERPKAKLAMIGDGPLMDKVKLQITNYKLQKNVKLFGYVFDGPKKYRILAQSRVVVHPAFYDSGGMAAAEAMAFGLPCVGFNLQSYESYYPKGMVKVKAGDLEAFAGAVIDLLEDRKKWTKVAKEALEMIEMSWSWEERAEEILERVLS